MDTAAKTMDYKQSDSDSLNNPETFRVAAAVGKQP